jgi:chromate transporter
LRVVYGRILKGTKANGTGSAVLVALGIQGTAATQAGGVAAASVLGLGAFFLKVGSVLYGSGYVLIAFLRNGLVVERQWLSEAELLDAVAVGQCTPGPLLSTSTFIGYLVQGWPGAIVATAGIFLPSFLFVLLTHRWIAKMRSSAILGGFLDAVNVAAVGLMVAVVFQLSTDALASWPAWVIGLLAAAGVLFTRVNPTWWIAGGGALGWLACSLGFAQ